MDSFCPKCGVNSTFQVVRDYAKDGTVIYETEAHQVDGVICLTRQLVQRDELIAELRKAIEGLLPWAKLDVNPETDQLLIEDIAFVEAVLAKAERAQP